jgi:predicted ATPase
MAMLTRLRVNGFKNLVDVDVRFGPFTCIAGVNGSGKSNLFDAITFLAALAEKPLVEAALSVRGQGGRSADIRSLFHRVGDQYADEMSFEAEMIIPTEGIDDLGQPIKASSTFLRYSLTIAYQGHDPSYPGLPLRIIQERLDSVDRRAIRQQLPFPYEPEWIETAVRDLGDAPMAFFETAEELGRRLRWKYWQVSRDVPDYGILIGAPMFRTFLSSEAAARNPTVLLAREEMRSWRVLQLNPAAIRKSSDFIETPGLGDDGSSIAATLYGLAYAYPIIGVDPGEGDAAVYSRVGNRLAQLIDDVRELTVDADEGEQELTIHVTGLDGTKHSARALSDGTLRFLALAVLEQQEEPGLYCIEEPENGMHPGRIPALLDLLQGIAMDTNYPIEEGNPLRQVIVSTHSPSVVMRVPEDSLVMAELWPSHDDRGRFKRARFRGLANTWHDPSPGRDSLALGTLLAYLNPEGYRPLPEPGPERDLDAEVRVMDRADLHRILKPTPRTDA